MITIINRNYCKKLIVLLPNQQHPEQYHKRKEETFIVLYGDISLIIDGKQKHLSKGDVVTIQPMQRHAFSTIIGCVIEEISSTHYTNDSFYTDNKINDNHNRKTIVDYWLA